MLSFVLLKYIGVNYLNFIKKFYKSLLLSRTYGDLEVKFFVIKSWLFWSTINYLAIFIKS